MIRNIIDQKDACYTYHTCKCSPLCRLILRNVGVRLRTSVILRSQISLRSFSQPTVKTTRFEILLCVVFILCQESRKNRFTLSLHLKLRPTLVMQLIFILTPAKFYNPIITSFVPSFKSVIKSYFLLLSGFIYIAYAFVYHFIACFY